MRKHYYSANFNEYTANISDLSLSIFTKQSNNENTDKELNALADKTNCFLSVEMNMGQMVNDIKVAIEAERIHIFDKDTERCIVH